MFNFKWNWATFSVLALGLGVLRIAAPVLGHWLHSEPPTPISNSYSIPNTQSFVEQQPTPVAPNYNNDLHRTIDDSYVSPGYIYIPDSNFTYIP